MEEQKKMEADEVDVLRRDNEELKDVLGSVQTELEVKTEVSNYQGIALGRMDCVIMSERSVGCSILCETILD